MAQLDEDLTQDRGSLQLDRLTPRQIMAKARRCQMHPADFLRHLAYSILESELSDGRRLIDASDFREWLIELAHEAERVA